MEIPVRIEDESTRSGYRLIKVDAPAPWVVAILGDVRVVASYRPFCWDSGWDYDPPIQCELTPRLFVEEKIGEDALGNESWKRIETTGELYPVGGVLSALARMVFDLTSKPDPMTFPLIQERQEHAASL